MVWKWINYVTAAFCRHAVFPTIYIWDPLIGTATLTKLVLALLIAFVGCFLTIWFVLCLTDVGYRCANPRPDNPNSVNAQLRVSGTDSDHDRERDFRAFTGWISPPQWIIRDIRIPIQLKRRLTQEPHALTNNLRRHVFAKVYLNTSYIRFRIPA